MKVTKRFSRSGGGLGGGRVPETDDAGGGGGGGEKIFFDDGQVKVTESLVTIGAPWNKAFAVREITSVTFGKNRSNELGDRFRKVWAGCRWGWDFFWEWPDFGRAWSLDFSWG